MLTTKNIRNGVAAAEAVDAGVVEAEAEVAAEAEAVATTTLMLRRLPAATTTKEAAGMDAQSVESLSRLRSAWAPGEKLSQLSPGECR